MDEPKEQFKRNSLDMTRLRILDKSKIILIKVVRSVNLWKISKFKDYLWFWLNINTDRIFIIIIIN